MRPTEQQIEPREFADALRRAIAESGLSLDRVRAHLSARRLTLSTATLSHWQNGRSLPERTDSLRAVRALEEILSVAPGALQALVPEPRPRGRRAGIRAVDDDVARHQIRFWDRVEAAASQMGQHTDDRLRAVTFHEVVDVGADRLVVAHRVRVVFVCAVDGLDHYFAYYGDETPHESLPRITGHVGCRTGQSHHDPEIGLTVTELLLPGPLSAGTRGMFEYDIEHVPVPFTSMEMGRVHPMRELVMIVRFHPDALPEQIRIVEHDGEPGPEVPTRLASDHSVSLIRHHLASGVTGLRWSWPD